MPRRQQKKADPPRKMPIRRGDIVQVRIGRDAPHGGDPVQGRVLRVYPKTGYCVVENVNMLKRHTKPNPQQGIKGGVVEKEGLIHCSNLKPVKRETKA